MDYNTKVLAVLIPLAFVDAVIPLPIIGIILIYAVLAKPPWFCGVVDKIYGRASETGSSGSTGGSNGA